MDNLFLWWELLSISSLSGQTCSVTAQLVKCWANDEDVGLNSEGAWVPGEPGVFLTCSFCEWRGIASLA